MTLKVMLCKSNRSCLQFPADEAGAGDVGGDVEDLDVPLEAQLEEGLAQLQVTSEVVRQLVRLFGSDYISIKGRQCSECLQYFQ